MGSEGVVLVLSLEDVFFLCGRKSDCCACRAHSSFQVACAQNTSAAQQIHENTATSKDDSASSRDMNAQVPYSEDYLAWATCLSTSRR